MTTRLPLYYANLTRYLAQVPPNWKKWIKRCLWTGAALYVIVGTFVWQFVFLGFVVLVTPSDMTNNEFHKTPLCHAGDWVLDTFQPLVSDARLIRHLNANREEMEKVAAMVNAQTHVDKKYALTPEFKALLKRIDIASVDPNIPWFTDPYAIEPVIEQERCARAQPDFNVRLRECFKDKRAALKFEPDFGRNNAFYFCNGRGTTGKDLLYFPGVAPRIENGELQGPISSSGKTSSKGKLVTSTDSNPYGGYILRQIDAHWFISRN